MGAQIGASAAAARAHEQLFAYWAGLRRGPRLPGRADIQPEPIKRLLPSISLIDVHRDPMTFRQRLAGTGLYGVYGREITGRNLEDIYSTTAADYWRTELAKIVDDRKPAVGMHSLSWRGAAHLSILWLRLPLARNGTDVDMILGYDAVMGMQGQLGSGIKAA